MRSTEFSALLQFFIIDVYKKKAGQAPFALARLCLSNANGVNLFIQGLRRFNRAGKVSFFRRARNGNQPIRSADACFISPPVASGKIPVVEHAYLFTDVYKRQKERYPLNGRCFFPEAKRLAEEIRRRMHTLA